MTVARRLYLSSVFLLVLCLWPACEAQAQRTRIVKGQVLDENGQTVEGAIVRLKDKKSGKEISVTTKKEGRYQFNGISLKNDYRLYAIHEKKKSRERGVSRFDTRPLLRINLKLEPPKEEKKEDKKDRR